MTNRKTEKKRVARKTKPLSKKKPLRKATSLSKKKRVVRKTKPLFKKKKVLGGQENGRTTYTRLPTEGRVNPDHPERMSPGQQLIYYFEKSNNNIAVNQILDNNNTKLNVNVSSNLGNTPIMYASGKGYTETVDKLLEKGANVNAVNNNGITALMMASGNGHKKIVEALLSAGADIKAVNNMGKTAIDFAALNDHENIIKILKDKLNELNE